MQVHESMEFRQSQALVAVAKLLWRISADDESDPDIKAAITATLSRGPGEDQDKAAGQECGRDGASAMFWPRMDLDFWKNVESLLDVESGIVLEGEKNFIAWFASVIKSQPAASSR